MVRMAFCVFGGWNLPSKTDSRTVKLPPSRSRADHRNASNSPIRSPVAAMRPTIVRCASSRCFSNFARLCDRDRKWSASVCERLGEVGVRVVRTPYQAPNANAYAERFVRSIKEECLNGLIPLGEQHFRQAVTEF